MRRSRSFDTAGKGSAAALAAVLLLALVVLLGTPALAADAPKISVTEQRYAFGTVPSGTVLEHVFQIANRGTALLQIEKVQPS